MATSWTDSTVSNSVKVKATHITQLKNAVQTLITNAGKYASDVSIGTINASTSYKISKANLSNLQKAVNSLQSKFSNNCVECQSSKQCKCETQCCNNNNNDCSDNDGDSNCGDME